MPFEQLPPAQVAVTEEVIINKVTNDRNHIQDTDLVQLDLQIELPITDMKMKELQEQDKRISHLRKLWYEKNLNRNLFTMENDILKRKFVENALLYQSVITPDVLKETLLMLAHYDEQGHNRFKRIYAALKTLYYWRGMK